MKSILLFILHMLLIVLRTLQPGGMRKITPENIIIDGCSLATKKGSNILYDSSERLGSAPKDISNNNVTELLNVEHYR